MPYAAAIKPFNNRSMPRLISDIEIRGERRAPPSHFGGGVSRSTWLRRGPHIVVLRPRPSAVFSLTLCGRVIRIGGEGAVNRHMVVPGEDVAILLHFSNRQLAEESACVRVVGKIMRHLIFVWELCHLINLLSSARTIAANSFHGCGPIQLVRRTFPGRGLAGYRLSILYRDILFRRSRSHSI